MQVNDIIHGFKVIKIKEFETPKLCVYEFEHIYSGAKTIYLNANDSNSVFAIGFKTFPSDDTGVFHILEHSVLCGSKKYPLKEPFVSLLKSSLATYLNAFTSSNWTLYPFASQTPKDFDNILSVYLDAVFSPLSIESPEAFYQEGWHLELLNKEDELKYNGVVYNEMKGATSSVEDIMYQATMKEMFKNTYLRFNSGGNPKYITDLTYEMYKDVYKKHYIPENSLSFFYGDIDIKEKLKFLDKEYFSKYKKQGINIGFFKQKPYVKENIEILYPLSNDEELKDNTYINLCYSLGDYSNSKEILAMDIVLTSLLGNDNSPLKQMLLEKDLGKNITFSIEASNINPTFQITLNKTNIDKKNKFKEAFLEGINYFVQKGIDKDLLLSTINNREFIEREYDVGRTPKGLVFILSIIDAFSYGEDLTKNLDILKYYTELKQELNGTYFEDLLKKYFLNSNHHVDVTMIPSHDLLLKEQKELELKLLDIKNKMSDKEIEQLIEQNKKLLAYQSNNDQERDFQILPKLSLKDIPSTINSLDTIKIKNKKYNLYRHKVDTNKIAYLKTYFDLSKLPKEDLVYTHLLKMLYMSTPTKKYSVLELNKMLRMHLGDLAFSSFTVSNTSDNAKLYFCVESSALEENIHYMTKMMNEVVFHSKFLKKDIKRELKNSVNNLKKTILEGSTSLASLEVESHFAKDAKMIETCLRGRGLYQQINEINKNFNYKQIKNKLLEVIDKVFTSDNVTYFIAGDNKIYQTVRKTLKKFKLSKKHYKDVLKVDIDKKTSKSAFVVPSTVSYNAACKSLESYNEKFSGKFMVLSHILNYDYLWNQIRVKGGAYGTSISFNRNNTLVLSSYRDPNVKNTYDSFEGIGKFLKSFKPTKKQFDSYIIGTLGGFDIPSSLPSMISTCESYILLGDNIKSRKKTKREIINTKIKDIKSLSYIFEDKITDYAVFTYGNKVKIDEYDFDKIEKL